MHQSCKKDSKPNWVICEIAIPPKNQIGLFAKLRKSISSFSQFSQLRPSRKFNCVICEIAMPFQNQIGLFAKLRFLRNRNYRNPFYNSDTTQYETILLFIIGFLYSKSKIYDIFIYKNEYCLHLSRMLPAWIFSILTLMLIRSLWILHWWRGGMRICIFLFSSKWKCI